MHSAIDLFAGPGGLSLGLKRAGFEVVGAIELDKDAGRSYKHNIGNHTLGKDITEYGPKEFRAFLEDRGLIEKGGSLDLIAGGPPCPGFSLIGRSKISDLIKKGLYGGSKDYRHRFIDDPRNQLFREFVKYVDEFRPRYFVMENVSGMSSFHIEGDPVIEVIERSFSKLGYDVNSEILSASHYGVPQERKRIIFLGTRNGEVKPEFPPKRTNSGKKTLDAADAILDLSQVEPTSDGNVRLPKDPQKPGVRGYEYRRLMKRWPMSTDHWDQPEGDRIATNHSVKTAHAGRGTNERDRILFEHIKSGAKAGKRGNVRIPDSTPRQVYGDLFPQKWEEVLMPSFVESGFDIREEDGRTFVKHISSGKEWILYDPQGGFKDKMRRINWREPSPTIVAHLAKDGYMFLHPWLNRSITIREAARIQSFPDSFEFHGSISSQYRQVGNAVPPLLAQAIGETIVAALDPGQNG